MISTDFLYDVAARGEGNFKKPFFHARYAYAFRRTGESSYELMRCPRDDVDRLYIDPEGEQHDCWEPYPCGRWDAQQISFILASREGISFRRSK